MVFNLSKQIFILLTLGLLVNNISGASSNGIWLSNTNGNNAIGNAPAGADSYEPDNTYTEASWLPLNITPSSYHNFHVAGDNDWMKFNTTAGWRYTIFTYTLGATSDTFMYLYDTNGTTILAYNDDYGSGTSSLIAWVAPTSGTYYIRVRHHSSTVYGDDTSYVVGGTIEGSTPDGYEIDNTYSQAKWIAPNGASATHTFHGPADYDWMKFNATAGLRYIITTFDLGATSDTFLYLYSTNGTTILGTNDNYSGLASQIAWTAPSSGTYYLRVRHHSSSTFGSTTNYSVEVTVGIPDGYETDDTYTQAKWISTDGTAMTHSFHDAADYDWVKFNTIAGWGYTITTSNLDTDCDTFLYLYSTDGTTILAFNDDYAVGPESQIIFNATISGTYYARVRHVTSTVFGPNTNYDIDITSDPAPKPAGGELVLVPDHKAVNPGETVNVEVCVRAEQPVTALDFHILNKSPFIQVTDLAARDNPLQPLQISTLPAVAEEFDGKPVAYDTPVQALFDAEVDLTAISCIADFKAQISSEANISDLLNIKAYGTAANASGEKIELRVGSLPLVWATKPTIHSVEPNTAQPGNEIDQ